MENSLSGPLLHAFLDEAKLDSGFIIRPLIATRVFGQKPHAKSRLTKCCSLKSDRHLSRTTLARILEATRAVLIEKFRKIGHADAETRAQNTEKAVCRRLGITSRTRAQVADFDLDARCATATTPQDFGIPDIMQWREGSFGFVDRLRVFQDMSVAVMRTITACLVQTSDLSRKLDLLTIAFSLSALNHPGSPWHSHMREQALTVAHNCRLLDLTTTYTVPPELRRRALLLLIDLHCLSFLPTLESPANVVVGVLRGASLSETDWSRFQSDIMHTLLAGERLLELDPQSERLHHIQAAYYSQHARLLAATGNVANLREADRLEKLSVQHSERASYPYGLLYPIQRSLVKSDWKRAWQQCQRSIEYLESNHKHKAAAAFAALLLQLTHAGAQGCTIDRSLKALAYEAVACPSTRYQYSHVFDAGS